LNNLTIPLEKLDYFLYLYEILNFKIIYETSNVKKSFIKEINSI